MKKILLIVAILAIGAIAYPPMSAAIFACKFDAIRDANPPMSTEQVEKSLGRPTHVDSSETTGITGLVYHYPYLSGEMRLVFINGTLFHAESIAIK